jgi:hypothetical protein
MPRSALVVPLLGLLTGIPLVGSVSAKEVQEVFCPADDEPYKQIDAFDEDGKRKTGYPKKEERPFKDGQSCCGDGVKDQLLESQLDRAGNAMETWCIQKRTGMTGQQFYFAFVPKGGKRHWYGGCFFPHGSNGVDPTLDFVDKKVTITLLKQRNEDYGGDFSKPPTGTADKHFTYFNSGKDAGKYQLSTTEGTWKKDGTDADGKQKWKYETDGSKTKNDTPRKPPDKPWQLVTTVNLVIDREFRPLTSLPDHPGVTMPAVALVVDASSPPTFEYRLLMKPWLDEGAIDPDTLEEAVVSSEGTIHAGDVWTITADGITSAVVSGDAALPGFGGWQLEEFDSQHATFVATATVTDTTLLNLPIGSFLIESGAPAGEIRWAYSGTEAGEISTTVGPSFAVPGKCSADKKKCTGRRVHRLLQCHAKAEVRGVPVDETCLLSTLEKHRRCFFRRELKGSCLTWDDASDLEAADAAFVGELVEVLNDGATPPVQSACAAAKMRCASKKVRSLLECHQEGDLYGGVVPACITKAEDAFIMCVTAREAQYAGSCLTTGDAGDLESAIDEFVDDVVCRLNPASDTCPSSPSGAFLDRDGSTS